MATVIDLSGNSPLNAPSVDLHRNKNYGNTGDGLLLSGDITVTTAVNLTLPAGQMSQGVTLSCPTGNAGTIYIGNPGVTSATGFALAAGAALALAVSDLSRVGYKATNAGDHLLYVGN